MSTEVEGVSANNVGVRGYSAEFVGVVGYSPISIGVVASTLDGPTALQIEGGVRITGNSMGFPLGTVSVTGTGVASLPVSNPFVEPGSLVLLTPLSDPGGPVWVTGVTTGSFTVNRSGTLPTFNFVYLIINLGHHNIGHTIQWDL
jgi:hypothetical protein